MEINKEESIDIKSPSQEKSNIRIEDESKEKKIENLDDKGIFEA